MHRMAPENSATEKRVVSVGDNAGTTMIGQVLAQPTVFRRPGRTATQSHSVAIRVQHHHMPRPQFIAVISLAARSGLLRPILVVRSRATLSVFMVAQRRPGARLEFAPRAAIAILKLSQRDRVI